MSSHRGARVGIQVGLRRISIRDRRIAGCPRIATVWVPHYDFDRGLSAARTCAEALGVPLDAQEVDP